jgi:enoyl-CoA hydratase/carnithine racemase
VSDSTPVGLSLEGGVWTATIAAPPANALSSGLVAGLSAALDEVEGSDAGALVLRSGIDRFFGAGGDVGLFGTLTQAQFGDYLRGLRQVLGRLAALEVPTVAVIDGMALGGGFELALNCHVRLLGPGAIVGLPEIKLGLLPGATGTQRLTAIVGRARADELMLSGRRLNAIEARDLGLGLAVDEKVVNDPQSWARTHLTDPGSAFRSIQRCTRAAEDPAVDGDEVELQESLRLFAHPAAQAGIQAFLARRGR